MPSKSIAKRRKPKWCEENLRPIAAMFASRADFAYGNKPAYEASRLLGLLDKWFGHQLNQWSESAIRAEAAHYTSRTEFANMSGAAYNAARRLGIIGSLFDSKLKTWNRDTVTKIAEKCENKKQMKRNYGSAYNAALRLGIIDDLFENQEIVNTRDCVYLWSVKDEPGLYKFGIVSKKIGKHRINQVAREANVTPEVVFIEHVGYDNAKRIERQMKKLGTPYKFSKKFYGHTEFRYMSPSDVEKCVNLSKTYNVIVSN